MGIPLQKSLGDSARFTEDFQPSVNPALPNMEFIHAKSLYSFLMETAPLSVSTLRSGTKFALRLHLCSLSTGVQYAFYFFDSIYKLTGELAVFNLFVVLLNLFNPTENIFRKNKNNSIIVKIYFKIVQTNDK